MNGFTYNNIFETKGTEYLVVILFFIVLIPFWIYLNKSAQQRERIKMFSRLVSVDSIRIPCGLFFSRFHTWAHLGSQGLARVGVDDLLMKITGKINVPFLKQPGEKIKRGDVMAILTNKDKQLNILSPISGEINSFNEHATGDELLTADPYLTGWLYHIKPSDWKKETNSCYLAEEAIRWTQQELTRMKDFLANSVRNPLTGSVIPVLQDGGELQDQPLSELPGEVWQDFQKEFLS